jgi:carboxypeptidase-like protein
MFCQRLIILLFLSILSMSIKAQEGDCVGTIIDAETGIPLPLATITIVSKSIGAISGVDGCIELPMKSLELTDSITVSYIGYQTVTIQLADLQQNKTLYLKPESMMLAEVSFKGEGFDISVFMQEVSTVYQNNKRETAHIAKGIFEQYGKINDRYAQYTICSGYAIYFGNKEKVAKMALYSFVPEEVNKSLSREEWLHRSKYWRKRATYLPLNGSIGYNSYQFFEMAGPLSEYTEKYRYKLDSVYKVGNEEVYKVSFNAKPTFDITANFLKGHIIVYANSKRIVSADIKGELLWSTVFHERVLGEMKYDYVYYDEQPFLYLISTFYRKQNIEERTILQVDLQKFDEFEIGIYDLFDIATLAINPDVIPNKDLLKRSLLDIDFALLAKELGFSENLWQQFKLNGGKSYWQYNYSGAANDIKRKQNAMVLMEEYKKFF